MKYKTAIYSSELGEDLKKSKKILDQHAISHIVLKSKNQYPTISISDEDIKQHTDNFDIIGIHTEKNIETIPDKEFYDGLYRLAYKIKPSFVIAPWNGDEFDYSSLQPFINLSIDLNFKPVIEYSHGMFGTPKIISADAWSALLATSKRLSILFDPVQYIFRMKSDPVENIFKPLYGSIFAIDVRDFLIGVGAQNIGFGSINWTGIMQKLDIDKYKGWLILEPSLKRFGHIISKHEIIDQTLNLLNRIEEQACQ